MGEIIPFNGVPFPIVRKTLEAVAFVDLRSNVIIQSLLRVIMTSWPVKLDGNTYTRAYQLTIRMNYP